ncbi:MAG: hypothetical protein J6574_03890 [Gilliamella sp.]|nr:hypothetical protein [Gilliamella sp.]
MAKASTMSNQLSQNVRDSIAMWNQDKNANWNLGTNYTNIGTEFQTYVNNYLFPKIMSTVSLTEQLGNRFNFLAREESNFIGQLNEEYVIKDSKPVDLNLEKNADLLFKRNYPKMITKLYGPGVARKVKFTLNDNNNRLNWSTLADAVKYAVDVYQKKISDINLDEETEIKAMLVDYGLNYISNTNRRQVSTIDALATKIFETVLNIQNNSSKYNEANTASNGSIGRYTTYTKLKNVLIVTTDRVKTYLLDTKIANTFQTAGIDITNQMMSFDDLGGSYKLQSDCIVDNLDINTLREYGDHQVEPGDIIPKGTVFTWDISQLNTFKNKVREIKPASDLFAFVLDANSIRYRRNTSQLLPQVQPNIEFGDYHYLMHYYTFKAISPFYNKIICEVPA